MLKLVFYVESCFEGPTREVSYREGWWYDESSDVKVGALSVRLEDIIQGRYTLDRHVDPPGGWCSLLDLAVAA